MKSSVVRTAFPHEASPTATDFDVFRASSQARSSNRGKGRILRLLCSTPSASEISFQGPIESDSLCVLNLLFLRRVYASNNEYLRVRSCFYPATQFLWAFAWWWVWWALHLLSQITGRCESVGLMAIRCGDVCMCVEMNKWVTGWRFMEQVMAEQPLLF